MDCSLMKCISCTYVGPMCESMQRNKQTKTGTPCHQTKCTHTNRQIPLYNNFQRKNMVVTIAEGSISDLSPSAARASAAPGTSFAAIY